MKNLEKIAVDGLKIDEQTLSTLKLTGVMARTAFYEALTVAGAIGIAVSYVIYNIYK